MPVEAVWTIVAGVCIAGVIAWFRFTLKVVRRDVEHAVRTTVNGRLDTISVQLDEQGQDLRELRRWSRSHDRKHDHEQAQLIASMERNGLSPPDGWSADTG